jgi:hypothetical protein
VSDPTQTRALGTSLALANGDFVLQGNDLALVSGRDNFVQSLLVIIDTPFGSDPVNINYGFDVAAIFTVANTVRSIKDVIRLNLVKSLSSDDRVQTVGDVVFDDDPEFAQLAPELASSTSAVAARRGRAWHAVATFTTVLGERQRIAVSGAMP